MPEDPLSLDELAKESGARLIPDAGIAPGLSNVLAGRLFSEIERVREIGIYVGGVPTAPVGPLKYSVTWNPGDLVEEYVRRARVIRGGITTSVDPLDEVEIVQTPLGEMEAFYTDGLRTLLRTLGDRVESMYEKTLRWRGHIERMKLLKDLGLMSDERIGGISPRELLAELLSRQRYDVADVVYLRVLGKAENIEKAYEVLVRGTGKWSAMQRAAGSVICAMVNVVKDLEPGVIPPEYLGISSAHFSRIIDGLKRRGVVIKYRITEEGVL